METSSLILAQTAKRLVISFVHTTASLLRMDRPSYAEGNIVNDKVFRSYAAVLCLERDAEASRRQAGIPGRLHLDQAPRGVSHAALVADAHGVASAGPAAR